MTEYVICSLSLVFIVPLVVMLTPSFRGLFVHACLLAFFHGMGALSLSLAIDLWHGGILFWGGSFFAVSMALYLGAVTIAALANRHRKDGRAVRIQELLRRNPDERILLQTMRMVWPLIMFPASRGDSSSRIFTGRRWIMGIKTGVAFCRLYLTNKRLFAQMLFPSLDIIDIDRAHVRSVGYVDRQRDLIGIRYTARRVSPLTKLVAFTGTPASHDLLFLNVGAESQRWLEALMAARSA